MKIAIDNMCLKLLALRQPMAADFRFISPAMKITTDYEKDNLVDGLNDQVIRELLIHMTSDPGTIPRGVHLMIVCRCLERIADLATNICEDVIFLVDAPFIKDQTDFEEEG